MDAKRKCSKCGKTKPPTEFKRYTSKERSKGWRYHPWCRSCFRAHDKIGAYTRVLRRRKLMKAASAANAN